MSCSLRSPIRTNKGREATETEGLVIINHEDFLFVCPEFIDKLVRPTDLKFGRGVGNIVSRN